MNLKNLRDQECWVKTQNLVQEEREILISVSISPGRLEEDACFLHWDINHFLIMAVKSLIIPEDQAYRRISAMKLLQAIPEIEEK